MNKIEFLKRKIYLQKQAIELLTNEIEELKKHNVKRWLAAWLATLITRLRYTKKRSLWVDKLLIIQENLKTNGKRINRCQKR